MPSHRGHMPPTRVNVRFSLRVSPFFSNVTAPAPLIVAVLKENALGEPMQGLPSRLNRIRNIALASVAVPTVERGLAPMRSWSTTMAVVNPSSTSTSGRVSVGMKPWTKELYVSLISRCDSAAIVPNTSELLPDPETPVNTVSRRFGISTLTSLRLFTRAPCTRMTSWLSATCRAGESVSVVVAVLIVSPSFGRRVRASDQPAAVAHQLAVGQLVGLTPSLHAAGRDAEPPVGLCLRPRVEAGPLGEVVASLPRQRVDLEDLHLTLDHRHVTGRAQPQPDEPGGGEVPARAAVSRGGHEQCLAVPVEGQRNQVRRTVRRRTRHPEVDVVDEPIFGVATTSSAGAGVLTHRSCSSPRTLPSASVTVATRRPPPTSRGDSFTVAPAAVTSASFASMSGTCQ